MPSRPPSSPTEEPRSLLEGIALRFLSYRPRFKAEVINRLSRAANKLKITNPLPLIQEITDVLEKSKFINDDKFLNDFIHYRLYEKKKGPFWIRQKLLSLGVPKSLIDPAIKENAPLTVQAEIIKSLIEKKSRGQTPDLKTKARMFRSLLSRGFAGEAVKLAFDDFPFEE